MNTTDDLIHAIIKYGIFKVSMNPDTRVLKFEEFDASEVSIQLGEIESEKAYVQRNHCRGRWQHGSRSR
jgi:hypothetical protein